MQETKPSPYTSEFWITMFSNALGIVQLCAGPIDVNNKYTVLAVAIINGLYAASRGIAKNGTPYVGKNGAPPPPSE